MESYIDRNKELYNTILDFLEGSEDTNQESFEYFSDKMSDFDIEGDQDEMTQFLLIIKSISDHHHRDEEFDRRMKEILESYKDQIKQTLSNTEIFHIFESNKMLVLFLLKNGTISISDEIYDYMLIQTEANGNRYCHFFYPELEQFKSEEEKMKLIKEDLLSHCPTAFEDYEEKRQEGQNDSFICSLIRKDSVEEFITYLTRNNISHSSRIRPSIFETNLYLIENKDTSLIEYSAFFGSIQIFRFLMMNKAELTPSLWLYSIHSKNAELIHLLESNQVDPPKITTSNSIKYKSYVSCMIESIKCHHKEFNEYFENSLILQREKKSEKTKENILWNSMKYHNYTYFQADKIKEDGFFYLCLYDYKKIVEILLKEDEQRIEKKLILKRKYFNEEIILTPRI